MCSKKMVVALPLWLSFYKGCSESVKQEILRISASTIDRYLHAYRVQHKRSFRSGTRAGSPWFKKLIPMRPLENHIQDWGHIEADTVAHCGNSLSGVFSWTLTLVDIQSGWTENTAMWGKSGQGVVCGIQAIERNMLFEMKGFYCDNGSEFLNKEVLKYFSCKGKRHLIQRGRPYKKNDQCHVEQKNYTHVRQLFGYQRINHPEAIAVMNDIYLNTWSKLQNFFIPQMRLIRKTRIGAKYKREYDKPTTPYERVLADSSVPTHVKHRLTRI